jgi:hypothetical protein
MESKPPFFVLGAQRSGTTMLRLMLNSHPHLCVPHESKFMTTFFPRLDGYGDLSESANVARLLDDVSRNPAVERGGLIRDKHLILAHSIASYADLIDAIMTERAKAEGKPRWGDKTPFYTPDIDILWHLFPEAKIIHLVRDGRDVSLSQRRISWLPNSLPRIAENWRWMTTICHKVGSVRGAKYFLEVRYEDVVRDTEAALRKICDFLDEPFAPEMLAYEQAARDAVPPESLEWHLNSVRSPNPDKAFAWKRELPVSDRIIFEQHAGEALELFGYELERHPTTWASRFKNLYYALVVRW